MGFLGSGTLIRGLAAKINPADEDCMIIGDLDNTKMRKITFGEIAAAIKKKLGIGTSSNLQTTSKEIVGAINELNSSLTTKREEKNVSTYLPKAILYRNSKYVLFHCAGMPQKKLQANTEYQFGIISASFRPIVEIYAYEQYNKDRNCRVLIKNDGTASVMFFDDVDTTIGININVSYIAE